jgi:hypothetical protein
MIWAARRGWRVPHKSDLLGRDVALRLLPIRRLCRGAARAAAPPVAGKPTAAQRCDVRPLQREGVVLRPSRPAGVAGQRAAARWAGFKGLGDALQARAAVEATRHAADLDAMCGAAGCASLGAVPETPGLRGRWYSCWTVGSESAGGLGRSRA